MWTKYWSATLCARREALYIVDPVQSLIQYVWDSVSMACVTSPSAGGSACNAYRVCNFTNRPMIKSIATTAPLGQELHRLMSWNNNKVGIAQQLSVLTSFIAGVVTQCYTCNYITPWDIHVHVYLSYMCIFDPYIVLWR